jgi:multicomponent Na+:H+ antiporter subunit B
VTETPARIRAEKDDEQAWHRPWLAIGVAIAVAVVLVAMATDISGDTSPLPAVARRAMHIALPLWGSTEPVSEIVYGSRGFDTFGETFLLFAAVVAVSLLSRSREARSEYVGESSAGMREQEQADPGEGTDSEEQEARQAERQEEEDDSEVEPDTDVLPIGTRAPERADGMSVIVRVAVRAAALILAVAAIYVPSWGYTPGGGFPAGAALTGVVLLLYTALGRHAVKAVIRPSVLEPLEVLGALLIIAVGLVGLAVKGGFLANWLPLAEQQTIRAGGTLQVFSAAELIEVVTGLTIALFGLLSMRHEWSPDEEENDDEDEQRTQAAS